MDSDQVVTARAVTVQSFISNILADQARIWSFPKLLARGKHWRSTILFLVITGFFLMIDPLDPDYFRHTQRFQEFNLIVSGHNATVAMWAVMIVSLLGGLLLTHLYLTDTFLYALEAVLDCEIVTQVLKGVDRRVRPQDVHTYRHLLDSWFRDSGPWYAGPGSFPSGHMIAATAIATVFAVRYRRHRWVPWMAYCLAATIGFSRIALLSHFPSDVFAAAVFGYVIARYVVLNRPGQPARQDARFPADQEVAGVGAMRGVDALPPLPYREAEPSE